MFTVAPFSMAQKQKITEVSISEWMDQESVAGLLNHKKRTNTFHLCSMDRAGGRCVKST